MFSKLFKIFIVTLIIFTCSFAGSQAMMDDKINAINAVNKFFEICKNKDFNSLHKVIDGPLLKALFNAHVRGGIHVKALYNHFIILGKYFKKVIGVRTTNYAEYLFVDVYLDIKKMIKSNPKKKLEYLNTIKKYREDLKNPKLNTEGIKKRIQELLNYNLRVTAIAKKVEGTWKVIHLFL